MEAGWVGTLPRLPAYRRCKRKGVEQLEQGGPDKAARK